jgi:hypothetical protein
MRRGIALLLCAHAAIAQHVQLTFGPHTFEYTEDVGTALSKGSPPPKALQAAALSWCEARANELAIPTTKCMQGVALGAVEKILRTRSGATTPRSGQNGLTPAFIEAVSPVFLASFGTEQLAPMLHALVRFHRPEKVVELGYGYTTPFLAQALADNAANAAAERSEMNDQRRGGLLRNAWYAENAQLAPKLFVVDDSSQRGGPSMDKAEHFARAMEGVLAQLDLQQCVKMHSSLPRVRLAPS